MMQLFAALFPSPQRGTVLSVRKIRSDHYEADVANQFQAQCRLNQIRDRVRGYINILSFPSDFIGNPVFNP
jgi:hypothetical protein